MTTTPLRVWAVMALATALSSAAGAQAFDPETDVLVTTDAHGIELLPATAEFGHELRVALPDGTVQVKRFGPGEVPAWSPEAGVKAAAQGVYTYELRAEPTFLQHRLEATGKDRFADSSSAVIASGGFTIQNGSVVQRDLVEATTEQKAMEKATVLANNDGVIRNSLCVGLDCPNSPSFGFDTLRLQENNLQLHFDDTSNSGSFPRNDWRLVANDSANGGASYLAIEDATAGQRVFAVSAGAPQNALFVDDSGRVGLGTSTPVLDMHIDSGNTPAVRLDQTTSGGFTAQTWDVAGNEANFFVRDATNGSTLPFRIRPGAPTSSIDISASGNVGVGTASPSNTLHVERSDGTAKFLVEETSGTVASRELMELRNNGGPFFKFTNTDMGESYAFAMGGTGHFLISHQQTAGVQLRLTQAGNLTISGTLTEGSSRAIKDRIVEVDASTVLAKLDSLPIAEWSYSDAATNRHVGPMAEDFYAAFGLGPDDKHVSPRDLAGIALAAAKALKAENEILRKKVSEVDDLRARLDALEARSKR